MKNQITSNKVTFQTTSSSKIECIKDDLTAQWFVKYTYKPMSKLEAVNGSWEFPTYQYGFTGGWCHIGGMLHIGGGFQTSGQGSIDC